VNAWQINLIVSVSEAWRDLRDVIINAADVVLGRMERLKYKKWFDGECEQVTNKKKTGT
jgi:hypothetical protein